MNISRPLIVVPVYRPDTSLLGLVSRLASGGSVLVVDDGSPTTSDAILRDVAALPDTTVLRFERNTGIARSLNAGLQTALDRGASWLLTIDQDSNPASDCISNLLQSAEVADSSDLRVGAIGCGVVTDAAGPIRFVTETVETNGPVITTAEELIQTGTLWRCEALQSIGGFDEGLAIDGVDSAACLRLRADGWHLVLSPEARIEHALGSAQAVRLFGRTVFATGHSAARRESIVRNRLRLLPEEFALSPKAAARSLRRLVVNTALAVTVEEGRWAKGKGSLRGLLPRHGK